MTDSEKQAVTPQVASARLDVVDVLRGFALAGLFLVHMMESYELYWAHPDKSRLVDAVYLLLMGKSFTLLALCFGFSFFILMDRAAKRGVDFTRRFAWRLLVLAGIGYLHGLIYRGDIIMVLAGMGFLLLLAHRVKNNRLLIALAVFCFLGPTLIVQFLAANAGAAWANQAAGSSVDPGMPLYISGTWLDVLRVNLWPGQVPKFLFFIEYGRLPQIFGLYLLGMVLGRIGFFERPGAFWKGRAVALVLAVALTLTLYFAREPLRLLAGSMGYNPGAQRALWTLTGVWLDLAATAVWALLLIALWQGWGRRLLSVFAPMGRLTLTFYIAQSAVFVPIFYGFGLGVHDDWDAATRFWVGISAIIAQILLAKWWLARFQYGPIEWLWRAATYTSWKVPFRKKPAVA
jgi:uncharacterized protein